MKELIPNFSLYRTPSGAKVVGFYCIGWKMTRFLSMALICTTVDPPLSDPWHGKSLYFGCALIRNQIEFASSTYADNWRVHCTGC